METAPEKPQQEAPAPSRGKRLACWFGIYSMGVVICLAMISVGPNGFPSITGVLGAPLLFPCGLGIFFSFFSRALVYYTEILACLSYGIYLLHLILTLRAKTRRALGLLIVTLVVLVCCNLVGCSQFASFKPLYILDDVPKENATGP
jgi:hypothetical protein